MICPNCQTKNPDQAKFCMNCAAPLQLKCPQCGTQAPAGAKFCMNCGHSLALAAGGDNLAGEQREVSYQHTHPAKPGADQRHTHSDAMQAERRVVTILFCDVTGSTAAAQQLDPEEWSEVMSGAFEHMSQPVHQYGGSIPRLLGDAIIAFFGAPVAHEDDPQRAVLAGLEIINSTRTYREQVQRRWGLDFDVRVGINTGLVVVGEIGSDAHIEFTALGDAVNLAARMEQSARPGTVLVAEDTYKLVAPLFEFEDLGELQVKGKDKPVHVYRPLRRKEQPGRLRGLESLGLHSPLLGREAEFGFLRQRLETLVEGRGSCVLIVGEAGLGKSRLVSELKQQVLESARGPLSWLEGNSISYGKTSSYYPWRQIMQQAIGATETEAPASVREKLNFSCQCCGMTGGDVPFLETMLAVESEDSLMAVQQYEGKALVQRMTEATRGFVCSQAQETATVMVFDDLHWADEASLELLFNLADVTRQYPLLIIGLLRPDKEAASWRFRQRLQDRLGADYSEINLMPLPDGTSRVLLSNLLAFEDLPEDLRAIILRKAEGNPFYVEEVVRTLIESGVVVREGDPTEGRLTWSAAASLENIEVPENLQSLLTARIDRLEEEARRTLQLASVIGRSFHYRLLEAINQAVAVVRSGLDQPLHDLQRAELIHEQARTPELSYAFRHSLTQEAAYSTILHKQRREFHRRVGEAIEELFQDRLDEFYALLSHHFGEAEDPRATRYAVLAGDAAFRLYAIPDAISHYRQAVHTVELERLGVGEQGLKGLREDVLSHIYLRLGRCLELQSDYEGALVVYEQMLSQADERGDQSLGLKALIAQAIPYAIPTQMQDAEKARDLSEKALRLAQDLGDVASEARSQWVFLLSYMYSGDNQGGIPYGERAAALAREFDLKEQLAHALQDLGLAYAGVGRIQEARQSLEAAWPIWEALGNKPMLAENLANRAEFQLVRGEFDDALALSEKGHLIAREIANEWGAVNNQAFMGLAFLARGQVDRLLEHYQEVFPVADRLVHPGRIVLCAFLAWMYESLGEMEKAMEVARQACEISLEFLPFHSLSLATLAGLHIDRGELAEAQKLIREARSLGLELLLNVANFQRQYVEVALVFAKGDLQKASLQLETYLSSLESFGARLFIPAALFLKARLLGEQGRLEEAKALLQEARRVAEETGHIMILWRILEAEAQLEARLGDQAEAARLRDQSLEVVERIAGNISDVELEASFRRYVAERALSVTL